MHEPLHGLDGTSAMTHAVLGLAGEFGETLAMAFGDEERVVAEAVVAFLFIGNDAFHAAGGLVEHDAVLGECEDAAESA